MNSSARPTWVSNPFGGLGSLFILFRSPISKLLMTT